MKVNKLKGLEGKKKGLLQRLPDLTKVLRATLAKRYLTCGRANCKCQRGEKHGPFYYLGITVGIGKTRQIQIRPDEITIAQEWIKNYRKTRIVLEQISQINAEILQLKKKKGDD